MKSKKAVSTFIFIGLLFLSLINLTPAQADGLLMIEGVYRQPVKSHINVVIQSRIATTTIEQTFRNDLDKQLVATYLAPVPPGATVTNFAQLINGQWLEATVKEREEAKAEFNNAAQTGKDASSVSGLIQSPVDPIFLFQANIVLPPQSERSMRLTYTQVLTGEVGVTRYSYLLSNTNFTDEPIADLLISVKIIENDEIRAVYSPSHQIEVSRPDKVTANAFYRAKNVSPAQDFEIVYTQSNDKFGLNLASYREKADEDGYFVLIAAPQIDQKLEVVQKDFVFILDRSGSMEGQKFEQAKQALVQILDALNPGDRFTIIAFDDGVQPYAVNSAQPLLPLEKREEAKAWVSQLWTGGGTNINDAVIMGLNTVDRSTDRPHIVVFLTDGQATAGVVDTRPILDNIKRSIQPQTRLFTIGVGDVNQELLEAMALENRGKALFVSATQPLKEPLGTFYASIDSPVLVDLALDFGNIEVYDLHPFPIPDMFLGGQVVISGRYKGSATTTITLTGKINGQKHVSTYENIKFVGQGEQSESYSFVPRLWAQRKIQTLLRTLQIEGPNPELIERVRELGLRYKIVTPYTSYIVVQPPENTKTPVNAVMLQSTATAMAVQPNLLPGTATSTPTGTVMLRMLPSGTPTPLPTNAALNTLPPNSPTAIAALPNATTTATPRATQTAAQLEATDAPTVVGQSLATDAASTGRDSAMIAGIALFVFSAFVGFWLWRRRA